MANQNQETIQTKDPHEVGRVDALEKDFKDELQPSNNREFSPELVVDNSQGTEHGEQNNGKYYHAHGKAIELPPQEAVNISASVVSGSAPEPIGQEITCNNIEEEADYWYDQFERLKKQNETLVSDKRMLLSSRNKYKAMVSDLQSDLDDEEKLHAETKANHRNEIDALKSKVRDIKASYIKSVNSLDTGLDSITDEEFEPKLRELHNKVNAWSRKVSHSGASVNPEQLHDDLKLRTASITTLKLARLVETVTWHCIENIILSAWFPTLTEDETRYVTDLHESVRAGGRILPPLPLKKAGESRHSCLTTIRSVQQPREVGILEGVHYFSSFPESSGPEKPQNSRGRYELDDSCIESLRDVACCARMLAAELRCQFAFYEVDQSIKLGDRYDPDTMDEATYSADVDEESVVVCIIANSLVRRPFPGSKDVAKRLSNAKVLVTAK
ncbi:hypothetical protein K440DRAFT_639029 [Wilcoxina mikolae CBS 423.85]|nr:hypothetical protein K440DRAFT_639029 [Wilcoxina mikolae CBS 423.85]